MRGPLEGEVAIVTGASSGIGAATARELARQGAAVVLAARRLAELDAQARAIAAEGGRATVVPVDVNDRRQLAHLAEEALGHFGKVDILVNNAGINWASALVTSSPEDISRLIGVNLLAAMLLAREVLPGMLQRRHGAIISVGSLSGRVAMEPLYSAAKYGLRGFSLALRRQVAGSGVSVSLVSPGRIRTDMTSQVRAALPEPELVAAVIADLVTHPRREVVVPRKHYAIAWLEQTSPAMADRAYRWRRWSPVP